MDYTKGYRLHKEGRDGYSCDECGTEGVPTSKFDAQNGSQIEYLCAYCSNSTNELESKRVYSQMFNVLENRLLKALEEKLGTAP